MQTGLFAPGARNPGGGAGPVAPPRALAGSETACQSRRMRAALLGGLVAVLAGAWGCATEASDLRAAVASGKFADALAIYERGKSPDPDALRAIAEATLARAAVAPENKTREAVFSALATSGTHARDVLEGLTGAAAPGVRARALQLLARLGNRQARDALLDFVGSADADARAASIEALDPVDDLARIGALAEAPAGVVRLAAVMTLAHADANDATRLLLARIARHDPRTDVRAATLAALAHQGAAAAEAIEANLTDADARVRMAAIGALVRADPTRARQALDHWVASDPSAEGIEAARVLRMERVENAADAARAHLARALASSSGSLRAQAAVALSALDAADRAAMAADHLQAEGVRAVKFALALAMGAEDARAWAACAGLMAGADVVAAQAATELARRNDATAVERLLALRTSGSGAVRRTVVRALGRDLARAHDIRALLLDTDVTVRIAAAAAILAGD